MLKQKANQSPLPIAATPNRFSSVRTFYASPQTIIRFFKWICKRNYSHLYFCHPLELQRLMTKDGPFNLLPLSCQDAVIDRVSPEPVC